MQNEDKQRVGEQKEPPGKVVMVQKKKKLWRCKKKFKKKNGKSTVFTSTKKCGPFENRNMYMSRSQIVKTLQGQGQLECKKMNSQALKKPLKQECSVDLFYSVKGQPSLALHCRRIAYDSGTALHALEKTLVKKGKTKRGNKSAGNASVK